ncbi:MAG: transglutaminase family protein [Hyphomicrobiaceae bacterium]|nr:transglutaminase family protein [Hyphomicrobiaceae bacterium]
MRYSLTHKTTYRYSSPVAQSHHLMHLTPRQLDRQRIIHHALSVKPQPAARIERQDYFGNSVLLVAIETAHNDLVIDMRSTVEVQPAHTIDVAACRPWERVADAIAARPQAVEIGVAPFLPPTRLTTPTHDIVDYARGSFPQGTPVLAGALDLTRRINEDFTFDATATDVSTPLVEMFAKRAGVCQDFSHLFLACVRALHIPARYVSGYILTHPPPGRPRLAGADASHAWVSVWTPEFGWVDFDPTNNLMPGEEHVVAAYGRDFDDVSPISGILLGGNEHTVTVAVDMVPLG